MTGTVWDALPWSLSGDVREQRTYGAALLLLAAGTLLCVLVRLSSRFARLDVLAAALASAGTTAWLLANGPVEGPTVLTVSPGNGVTAADLLVVPAVGLVSMLVLLRSRRL